MAVVAVDAVPTSRASFASWTVYVWLILLLHNLFISFIVVRFFHIIANILVEVQLMPLIAPIVISFTCHVICISST